MAVLQDNTEKLKKLQEEKERQKKEKEKEKELKAKQKAKEKELKRIAREEKKKKIEAEEKRLSEMTQSAIDEEYAEKIEKAISTGKLQVGKVYKNYGELCDILGEIERTGGPKAKQIKRIKRFLDVEKIEGSQNIKVKEIYETPKASETKQNAFCTRLIEWLLMEELKKKTTEGDKFHYEVTKMQLLYELGIINEKYLYQNREQAKEDILRQRKGIEDWDIEHFFLRTHQKLNEILMSALKSMNRRCVLIYHEEIAIEETKNGRRTTRVASKKEEEQLIKTEKEILKKMHLEQKPYSDLKNFYNILNKELKKKYGWNKAYKRLSLVWTRQYIGSDICNVVRDIQNLVTENKELLTEEVKRILDKDAIRKEQRNKETIDKFNKAYEMAKEEDIKRLNNSTKNNSNTYEGVVGVEAKKEIVLKYGKKAKKGIGRVRYSREEFDIPYIKEFPMNYAGRQKELAEIFIATYKDLLKSEAKIV